MLMQLPVLNNRLITVYDLKNLQNDLLLFKNLKQADTVHGGFSAPSKMPGWGYGLPSSKCKTGSKLKVVAGSVCFSCYAADDWDWVRQGKHHSNYAWRNVKAANARRFESLFNSMWVPAMIFSINRRSDKFFRWHDSGDLQSIEHLKNICIICDNTKNTQHWLPTREYEIIDSVDFDIPSNLCIRVSAHIVDKNAPARFDNTSSVIITTIKETHENVICPVSKKIGQKSCGNCRSCWDRSVKNVSYIQH